MSDEVEDYENLAHTQRLKAAVHYTTGRICEEASQDMDVTINKQFIAVLSEAAYKYSQRMGTDLELFAKHAKRTTVNPDDVKLLVRKSPVLYEYISELSKELAAANEEKRTKRAANKKTTRKKATAADAASSTSHVVAMDDEDSNL